MYHTRYSGVQSHNIGKPKLSFLTNDSYGCKQKIKYFKGDTARRASNNPYRKSSFNKGCFVEWDSTSNQQSYGNLLENRLKDHRAY